MPAFDLVNLAILWCIGLLALLQTLNTHGAFRAALSGIVTVLILVVAGLFSYLKVESYGSFVSEELSPPSLVAINDALSKKGVSPTAPQENGEQEAVPDVRQKSRESSTAIRRYAVAAKKIADEGIAAAEQIAKTQPLPNGTSEANREIAENKALSIRNATAKVNSRATSLFHPKSLSPLHGELVRASESLRLAGYALHAYTTIEDSGERRAQFDESKRQAKNAAEAFAAYKASLEKLP